MEDLFGVGGLNWDCCIHIHCGLKRTLVERHRQHYMAVDCQCGRGIELVLNVK